MRYYYIAITNATTGKPILDSTGQPIGPYSTLVGNTTQIGALDVELDIAVFTMDAPIGQSFLRIYGVGLPAIGQAANLNGANIAIYGGMSKGLTLANPAQAGLLLQGTIQQAYGNWQGIMQSLDLVVGIALGSPTSPVNVSFNWGSGQQLSEAVTQSLKVAFPTAKIVNSATASIPCPYDTQPGYYQSVGQFSTYVKDVSQQIIGGAYTGLLIVPTSDGFKLIDGTTPTTPKTIEFADLIGQPTWIGPLTTSIKVVMRATVQVGDYIKLPQTFLINTAQSYSQYRQNPTFPGVFQIQSVRHIGHYRQASADAWVTVIEANQI